MVDHLASARHYNPQIIRANIIFSALSTVFIVLRIWSKLSTKNKLGVDDAFIILAQFFWYGQATVQIYATTIGFEVEKDFEKGNFFSPQLFRYFKFVYFSAQFYYPVALCTSLSVLSLYWRLFPVQGFRRLVKGAIVLNVLWAVACCVPGALMCLPLKVLWTPPPHVGSRCINYRNYFYAVLSFETALNTITLVLPVQQVLRLQLDLKTRLVLAAIFFVGSLSAVSGIIRLVQSTITHDQIIDWPADMFWVTIHLGIALLCASLPTYRPLVRAGASFVSDKFRSRSTSTTNTSIKAYQVFDKGHSPSSSFGSQKTDMSIDEPYWPPLKTNANRPVANNYRQGGIRVQRSVDVVRGHQYA